MKERKVRMLSISELFMNRKRLFLISIVSVVCVLLLLWVLRTNPFALAGSPEPTASSGSSGYQAAVLMLGFENGIFTTVSGSGAFPTVITFTQNESGAYVLLQYQEPQDGALYLGSVKKMFPQKLWTEVLTEGKRYTELVTQKEEQAAAYLKSIGREAKVSAGYIEKKLVDINVDVKFNRHV